MKSADWNSAPPQLQIFLNLPLQIYWNLLAEIPPKKFADFLKSGTVDLLKSAGSNSPPPQLADFLKSATAD